ncbi:signal peptidase I [Erythrobacter crassostreae]|uniref:Signal peptidase I n=1 Tax=Erythrobacter crassostreae TaxID=2828328 RepID=A0A9X1F3Q9_9SPHN|nr:signal peptidase I [Erythrobacter crassostrea]MBV7259741.1 signal peptidase I [Erythrobacter crassostrea]
MNVKTQTAPVDTVEDETGTDTGTDSWWSFTKFVLKLVTAVLIFRICIFSPFSIPSESMLPRLMNGDYLLAAKWSYGFSGNSLPFDAGLPEGRILASQPERGDMVIFKHPIDNTDYIKRVIALPGDRIAVLGGQLVLNGEFIPREQIADFDIPVSINTSCSWGADEVTSDAGEQVCRYRQFKETLPGGRSYNVLDFGLTQGDSFEEVTIPEGHMFVMGDNRDNSRDSRFEAMSGDAVGIVPQDKLVGEAFVIMWSTDGGAEWLKPWTWFSSARGSRIGTVL